MRLRPKNERILIIDAHTANTNGRQQFREKNRVKYYQFRFRLCHLDAPDTFPRNGVHPHVGAHGVGAD